MRVVIIDTTATYVNCFEICYKIKAKLIRFPYSSLREKEVRGRDAVRLFRIDYVD